MTITIELPDEAAERLARLPEAERKRYATAALVAGMEVLTPEEEAADFADAVAALEEAFAEIDAEKDRPFAEYVAEREAFWKARSL
jgi:TRAP-type C4-dicarboxylate transport system substrate-binding protein